MFISNLQSTLYCGPPYKRLAFCTAKYGLHGPKGLRGKKGIFVERLDFTEGRGKKGIFVERLDFTEGG